MLWGHDVTDDGVTAWVLAVLTGSFTSQIETVPPLT